MREILDGIAGAGYDSNSLGLLLADDGPWANDIVSYADTNTLRTRLTAQRPGTTDWALGYSYDGVNRLRFLSVPASSTFEYGHGRYAGEGVPPVAVPARASAVRGFDSKGVAPRSPGLAAVAAYPGFPTGGVPTPKAVAFGRRGAIVLRQGANASGSQVNGGAPRAQEQWGYQYDRSGNLAQRVKSGLVETLGADANNQLTGASASGTFTVAGVTTSSARQVAVNGQAVPIYADYSWALTNVSLTTTAITAVATDGNGNASIHSIKVNLASPRTYQYDLNRNLIRRGQEGGSGALAGSFGPSTLSLVASRSLKDMRATRFASGAKIHGAIASLPPVWTRPSDGRRTFAYDSEEQLIQVIVSNRPNHITKSDFVYDARGRRRVRTEGAWQNGAWLTNQVVRYVYDGNLVLQERDGNNTLLFAYVRGLDLSGTLDGAGGWASQALPVRCPLYAVRFANGSGGLLARTYVACGVTYVRWYGSDANGNVTSVMEVYHASSYPQASCRYDPFGNLIAQSGGLAEVNLYWFSSKEFHPQSGLYYYGRRFYDPGLQRWLNRDPIEERGGVNIHAFCGNNVIKMVDMSGLIVFQTNCCDSITAPNVALLGKDSDAGVTIPDLSRGNELTIAHSEYYDSESTGVAYSVDIKSYAH